MKEKLLAELEKTVAIALAEDIGGGDVTADLVPVQNEATAQVICRENAVICGIPWFNEVFKQLGGVEVSWDIGDGDHVVADSRLCQLKGNAAKILTGERTALNFMQLLSATATVTAEYAKEVSGTTTRILDTRKTIPGLRLAQKYAVACGGGVNHRIGLYDAVLIKENHIMAAGSIAAAVVRSKELNPDIPVEVEVENMRELQEVLDSEADSVLLDNFSNEKLREAVKIVNGRIKTEASGGLEKSDLAGVADTGVDFISIGALTKNVKAVDLSMRFEI
ncbi:MAG: carboxylating nicotinate-nucleotide diphosphorylase [Gammaproteobacteria bacterium]|nr:MAG: carboxylating nicotinate-nucleotide diphosphorylase [Gammaproteobacteria bacterium]